MTPKMKVLIAHDGSNCADAALEDLRRAGLPPEAEVVVFSVADVWLPPPSTASEPSVAPAFHERITAAREAARRRGLHVMDEARALALRASEQLQTYFPDWDVHADACADSPAWGVLKKIDDWQPDLVVVGSHGRSALGRFILGSVSQKVVTEARCAVRVARGRLGENTAPVRLVIGVDGSPDADAAVRAVAERLWRPGSEARVIAVLDHAMATAVEWDDESDAGAQAGVHKMVEAAVEKLRVAGLVVSSVVKEGDPKRVLVEEADEWGADCIFVGARGLRRLERFLLGSVSTSVATRAQCSVEVVRPRQIT